MAQERSASVPEAVEWTLRHPRTKEVRHYEQIELVIEGEARLIGLARNAALALRSAGYSWDQLTSLFDDGPFNFELGFDLLGVVIETIPELAVEASMVAFGIFPVLPDGTRNEQYEGERAFLRGTIKTAHLWDMYEIARQQNDFARLLGPFSKTLAGALGRPAGGPQSPGQQDDSETGLRPPFDPWTPQDEAALQTSRAQTQTSTTDPKASETATPSDSSPNSAPSDSEPPARSGGRTPADRSGGTSKP